MARDGNGPRELPSDQEAQGQARRAVRAVSRRELLLWRPQQELRLLAPDLFQRVPARECRAGVERAQFDAVSTPRGRARPRDTARTAHTASDFRCSVVR